MVNFTFELCFDSNHYKRVNGKKYIFCCIFKLRYDELIQGHVNYNFSSGMQQAIDVKTKSEKKIIYEKYFDFFSEKCVNFK